MMTIKKNKDKEITSIFIYFKNNQIPKDLKNYSSSLRINDFSPEICLIQNHNYHIFLNKLENLDNLQINYFLFILGQKLSFGLKNNDYRVDFCGSAEFKLDNFFLGWELGTYRFENFKTFKFNYSKPKSVTKKKDLLLQKEVYFFVRDLINYPANLLGPKEIYLNTKKFLGKEFSDSIKQGTKLKREFPLVHAVGNASSGEKKPLFCEFKTSNNSTKKIYLIGKGITFDTGGLNLKLGSGMSLMKKDMGGAANCIGLAKLINSMNLDINIHLLLCLAENSVSENSIRPSDIIKSRSGEFIEVADTDAEGRLVMADAITYACENSPELIIDMSTLTGASRVAMGLEVPSFFSNKNILSNELIKSSKEVGDPLWQLPLWKNYEHQLKSLHADFKNIGANSFGGAITAALFLNKFVKKEIPWIHIDLMAWSKPTNMIPYEGGEAMGIRALADLIKKRFK